MRWETKPAANGSTSTGSAPRPSLVTCLPASTMTIIRSAAAATIFSRSMAPPLPLIARNCGSSSSAPSMARSSLASVSKGSTGRPAASAARRGGERRGDGRHLQARRDPFSERGDGEARRRSGAEADEHPVLDLGDRGTGRRALARRGIVLVRCAELPRRLLHFGAADAPQIICLASSQPRLDPCRRVEVQLPRRGSIANLGSRQIFRGLPQGRTRPPSRNDSDHRLDVNASLIAIR